MNKLRLLSTLIVLLGLFTLQSCVEDLFNPEEEIPLDTRNYELTEDPTDYTEDFDQMRQFYENYTIPYFAEHGLPAIANQSELEELLGENPFAPFESIFEHFDAEAAQNALDNQAWNQEFINKMYDYNGASLDEQWALTVRYFANELQDLLLAGETAQQNQRVGLLYQFLGDGLNQAVRPDFFQAVAFSNAPLNINTDSLYNELCLCEMELFLDDLCDGEAKGADDNATEKQNWDAVRSSYNTSKNGKCATLAVGLCLNKLNKIGKQVDGKTWNKISCDLQANADGGAGLKEMNQYYRGLGYGVKLANLATAKKDLARGCDLKVAYTNKLRVGGEQHIEYVRKIECTPNQAGKGKVHTISWGEKAHIDYTDDDFGGKFSGKSDSDRYGASSFLRNDGHAFLISYCKK